MAREILYLKAVSFLCFLQDYIYSLNGKDRSFLTQEYRCIDACWVYTIVALDDVLLQLRIQADDSGFSCLFLNYGKFSSLQYLPPA